MGRGVKAEKTKPKSILLLSSIQSEARERPVRGEILPFPPRTNTMAVRTADLPDPFSPDRKVSRWLGVKVNFYNKTPC